MAVEDEFNLTNAWTAQQNTNMQCITHKPPGFDLPRKHGPRLTESELNMADVHTLYTNGARNHLLSVIAEKSRPLDISQKSVPYDHIMVDQKTY